MKRLFGISSLRVAQLSLCFLMAAALVSYGSISRLIDTSQPQVHHPSEKGKTNVRGQDPKKIDITSAENNSPPTPLPTPKPTPKPTPTRTLITVLYIHVGKTGSTVLQGLHRLSKDAIITNTTTNSSAKDFLHQFHVNFYKSAFSTTLKPMATSAYSTCLLYPCILLRSPSCPDTLPSTAATATAVTTPTRGQHKVANTFSEVLDSLSLRTPARTKGGKLPTIENIIPYDLMILWVRDPLARFISIWQAGKAAENKEDCNYNNATNVTTVITTTINSTNNYTNNNTTNNTTTNNNNNNNPEAEESRCLGNLNDHLTNFRKVSTPTTNQTKTSFANHFLHYINEEVSFTKHLPVLHHMRMDLPWYMGVPEATRTKATKKCTSLLLDQVLDNNNNNNNIHRLRPPTTLFVGRTEYTEEDTERLRKFHLPQDATNNSRVPWGRDWSHHYQSQDEQLSDPNVRFLKEAFQLDYDCLQTLVDRGYLDQDYVSQSRDDMVYHF